MFHLADQPKAAEKIQVSPRQREIMAEYIRLLDEHMVLLKAGEVEQMLEISDFADMLHIHPVHLSNTIKAVTGRSSCSLFEERLVNVSKELLLSGSLSIKAVAMQMTYDPSNFTKFFKKFTGQSPKEFRAQNLK